MSKDKTLEQEIEEILLSSVQFRHDGNGNKIVIEPTEAKAQLLHLIDTHCQKRESEAVDNVLDELLEWYEVKSQMSAQPFNWYGAVKALKISKDHKKPFNVLKQTSIKEREESWVNR